MDTRTHRSRLLAIEVIGFSAIIGLLWLEEYLPLRGWMFGGEEQPDWRDAAIETLLVVAVGAPILLVTRGLLRQLYYLEKYPRVCAWCQRAAYDGEWLEAGVWLARRFEAWATHGACPSCAARLLAEVPGAPSGVA
jgi:hypothetical protein